MRMSEHNLSISKGPSSWEGSFQPKLAPIRASEFSSGGTNAMNPSRVRGPANRQSRALKRPQRYMKPSESIQPLSPVLAQTGTWDTWVWFSFWELVTLCCDFKGKPKGTPPHLGKGPSKKDTPNWRWEATWLKQLEGNSRYKKAFVQRCSTGHIAIQGESNLGYKLTIKSRSSTMQVRHTMPWWQSNAFHNRFQ